MEKLRDNAAGIDIGAKKVFVSIDEDGSKIIFHIHRRF